MGIAELLAPFAMWGAALGGAALLIAFVTRLGRKLAKARAERDAAREDSDAMQNFQKGERRWRDLSRAERVKRLLNRARKHRS